MITKSSVYRHLLSAHKKETFIFLALSIFLTLLQAPVPYITGYLIDKVLPSGNSSFLVNITLILGALFIINIVVDYFNSRLKLAVRRESLINLSTNAIRGILKMPRNRRLGLHNGDLISRLTRDSMQLNAIMPYGWSDLIHKGLLSITLLVVVFVMNWQMSLVIVMMIPASIAIYFQFDKALWRTSKDESIASAKKLSVVQETIEADEELKAYAAEEYFTQHVKASISDYEEKSYIRALYDTKVGLIISGMPMLAMLFIWLVGGHKVMAGEMTVGLIITYTSTLAMMVPALIGIIEFVSALPNELTALDRITSLFDDPQETALNDAQSEHKKTDADISVDSLSVEQMSFRYSETQPIFRDLNIRLSSGNAYLINGGNGAGKSTLLSILGSSLRPDSGSVLLDDIDLTTISDKSSFVTYVPQRVHIFSDTIRRNLTLGQDFNESDVTQVLNDVGLGDWFLGLEDGLDHTITNASNELSGGQVQKMAIARALLRDSPVLLMDEPTNNLDSQAVNLLLEHITSHKKDRIVVIVSHDDRVFKVVDKLVYLENSHVGKATQVTVSENSQLSQ